MLNFQAQATASIHQPRESYTPGGSNQLITTLTTNTFTQKHSNGNAGQQQVSVNSQQSVIHQPAMAQAYRIAGDEATHKKSSQYAKATQESKATRDNSGSNRPRYLMPAQMRDQPDGAPRR